MSETGGENEIKIINPYNFNNKLINSLNIQPKAKMATEIYSTLYHLNKLIDKR